MFTVDDSLSYGVYSSPKFLTLQVSNLTSLQPYQSPTLAVPYGQILTPLGASMGYKTGESQPVCPVFIPFFYMASIFRGH